MSIKAIIFIAIFAILGSTNADATVIQVRAEDGYRFLLAENIATVTKNKEETILCRFQVKKQGTDKRLGNYIHAEFICTDSRLLSVAFYPTTSVVQVGIMTASTPSEVEWATELPLKSWRVNVIEK